MKGSLLLYNLKLNCLIFSTVLNSSLIIFIQTTDIYLKLSKCIGQTPFSYEHYLVVCIFTCEKRHISKKRYVGWAEKKPGTLTTARRFLH